MMHAVRFFIFLCAILLVDHVQAQYFVPRFVIPNIVSPNGHPPLPKAMKLTRADFDLRGPVKECNEYDADWSEEDRKLLESKRFFNPQGLLTRNFQAGSFGFNRQYNYGNGIIMENSAGWEGSTRITLNSDGLPVTLQSRTQGTRFNYTGRLLTGSSTLYRQQIEEMDGSVRIDSSRESVSYRYDAAGRLVEHKKLVNGLEIYRIYYRYNAAGQVDSIAEKRDKEPVLCFQLSYTTTSEGNTEVSYKEINYDLGISASSGRFSFSPEGRLLLYTCGYNKYYENYPSKFPRLQILYIFKYDSYGNWIECKRQYNNPPRIKEWEDFNLFREITTIRKISYH